MSVETEFDDSNLPDVEETENEARKMGWVPEEEFKGKKDHWVSAEEFVERGRTLMPILRQNNRRLQQELDKQTSKVQTLETKLSNAERVMEKLEKHFTDANRRAVDIAKAQLKEELKQAREDGDVDKEFEVQDKLDDLRKRVSALDEETSEADKSRKADEPRESQYSPEFKEWLKENSWFDKDKKKTKLVVRIGEDLREEGIDLTGREFMDACMERYDELHGENEEEEEKPVRRTSKVESSSGRKPSKGGSKSYADLPAAAKQACDEDADDLVGEGRRYKTLEDWRKAYAKIYFAE